MSSDFDFSLFEQLAVVNRNRNHPNLGSPNMTVFSGTTGSGKTYLLFQCLLTDNFFEYDELYVLTSTSESLQYNFLKYCFHYKLNKNIILGLFKYLDRIEPLQVEEVIKAFAENVSSENKQNNIKLIISDQLNEFPSLKELNTPKKKLVIGDDVINNDSYNKLLETYFTRGRHYNISCIYLTQNFTLVPITIRRNLSNLFLFKTGANNLNYIYREVVSSFIHNKNDFISECNRTWKTKHSYIFINKIDGKYTDNVFETIN